MWLATGWLHSKSCTQSAVAQCPKEYSDKWCASQAGIGMVIRHWHKFAREAAGNPSSEALKAKFGWGFMQKKSGLVEGVLPMAGGLEIDCL